MAKSPSKSGAKKSSKNGTVNGQSASEPIEGTPPQIDPAMLAKISEIRSKVHETFGKVSLAMMTLPRYRHLSLFDLNQILLDPLIRDRVAIASASSQEGQPDASALSGIAIWASVSEEVDAKIREQVKSGVFPVKLQADDWNSGTINWLFDVIAPNQKLTASVIANFKQVIKGGNLNIHPLIARLVDRETLEKMGVAPVAKPEDA